MPLPQFLHLPPIKKIIPANRLLNLN
jgi:hypothetical protein